MKTHTLAFPYTNGRQSSWLVELCRGEWDKAQGHSLNKVDPHSSSSGSQNNCVHNCVHNNNDCHALSPSLALHQDSIFIYILLLYLT